MTITNGYATLAEIKQRLLQIATYTAATISFTAASKKIADSARGLARFRTGSHILISGSTSNDGYYTVATGDNAAEIVVSETLVNEVLGDTVSITDVSNQADDATLEQIIEAASRAIDARCRRRFWANAEDADEVRYYGSDDGLALYTDDILSITELATDVAGNRDYTRVWATTDYDLLPDNAVLDGKPYTWLKPAPNGRYAFSTYRRGNRITGQFGYSITAPGQVREACVIQSTRWYRRQAAPFGVVGGGEFGTAVTIPKLDPDVETMLKPFARPTL